MRVDFITLFPDMISGFFSQSIIARGIKHGHLTFGYHQIRDFTLNRQKQVDDYPYGGGHGMVMQADPLYRCFDHVVQTYGRGSSVLLSPQGTVFCQQKAKELASLDHIIFICGHYEGVDERFIEECVDEELSVGDYVLTGGEIAAAAVADAVGRLIPGVLAEEISFEDESFWDGSLEYPQYSRPEIWHGKAVPEVLLSGHHENIRKWREEQSRMRTALRRPDLKQK